MDEILLARVSRISVSLLVGGFLETRCYQPFGQQVVELQHLDGLDGVGAEGHIERLRLPAESITRSLRTSNRR